ncbi:MAG: tetratricopeptide repeat protein [Abitibacteriaceae bacterium]|nr:tetratricopeptide repeat protein [Abditibacteriaceae bacterium]MBV9866938.1 tetratricopeptide repeat protein [Abditibacteriaceae bacterium]
MNWNLLDEQWKNRHDKTQLAALEQELDRELFRSDAEREYPLLWRWARLSHFRAMQAGDNEAEARRHYEAGAEEAKKAVALQPNRVEGHFWYGVNFIEAARRRGWVTVARAMPIAMRHIERAVAIDEAYHFTGPLRVWGKLTHQKPLLMGGSIDRALDIYVRALQICPDNSTTLLYYAETLIADQKRPKAREVLNKILNDPDDPEWRWEQERDRGLARQMMDSIKVGS